MRKVRAFTLIEILVVIAIIALLSGIILAVLPAARKRSYEAVCISHLRQLGQAFAMYKQDWGGIEAEKGRYYEPWQLGLPPRVFIPLSNGDCDTPIGTVDLWQCPASDIEGRCAFKYASNFPSCFKPPEQDPLGTCHLWKEAVYRLGQEAWLLLDDNHCTEARRLRQGHCPVILLNLNFEVRRFPVRWDASFREILWQPH